MSLQIVSSTLALVLAATTSSLALDYPCPSDPGFCYRDFGNDGCFDAGTDDGPINTEIEDINYRGDQDVFIEAVDTIDIDSLVLKSSTDVTIDTLGATVNVLNSRLIGIKNSPTFEISAGAGSTCDITGTPVKKATLVTNCDAVVGP